MDDEPAKYINQKWKYAYTAFFKLHRLVSGKRVGSIPYARKVRNCIYSKSSSSGTPVRGNRAFDVIHIDIEGAEMTAFSGMPSVIERSHNLSILMEFTPGMYQATGPDPHDFLRDMLKQGFNFWEIDERNGGILCLNQNDVINLCDKPQSNLLLDRYGNSESLIKPLVIQRK